MIFLPSISEAAIPVQISTAKESRLLRVIFHSDQPVNFSAKCNGTTCVVQFQQAVKTSTGAISATLRPYVRSASLSANGKTLTLQLSEASFRPRKFVSDRFVGIDLLYTKDTPLTFSTASKEAPKETPKEAPKPTTAKPAASSVAKVKKAAPAPTKKTLAPAEKATVQKHPAPVVNTEPLPPPSSTQAAAPSTTPTPQETTATKQDFNVRVENVLQGKRWVFPFDKEVAAAAFYRAGWLWVVFSSPEQVNFSAIQQAYGGNLRTAQQIPNSQYTILRFESQALSNIKFYRRDMEWILEAYSPQYTLQFPAHIISEYYSPHSRGLFFPVYNVGPILRINDPQVGDLMAILPMFQSDQGVSPARHFPDFSVLNTAQGMVIVMGAENVKVDIIPSGIEITSPLQDLSKTLEKDKRLSKAAAAASADEGKIIELPKKPHSEADSLYTTGTRLFPFDRWRSYEDPNYTATLKELQNRIISVTPSEQSKYYFDLARFFFAHGLHQETLGTLRLIGQLDPPFAYTAPVRALEAGSYILLGNYLNALKTLDKIPPSALPPDDYNELLLWQDIARLGLGTGGDTIHYLTLRQNLYNKYPLPLQHRFGLMEAEARIEQGEVAHAEQILNIIEEEPITQDAEPRTVPYLTFLKAALAAKKGDERTATQLWTTLSESPSHRFFRLRAGLALTQYLLDKKKITPSEAIDRLNRFRHAWRGDIYEVQLLRTLGKLYVEEKKYSDALRAWRQAVTYFSGTGDALFITAEMSKLFVYLFAENGSNSMTDFEAISLYYEYKELTPIGKAGDTIVQNLARRLIKLDLLDRASALLSHQVRYRVKEGPVRAYLATQLAAINLLNKQPEQALVALTLTASDTMDSFIKKRRTFLMAKAMAELHKVDEALALLKDDNSTDATAIRLDIHWSARQWEDVRQTLSPAIDRLAAAGTPISPGEGSELLQYTIAHLMLKNYDTVQSIYERFRPRLPSESALGNVLQFLASDKGKLDYDNLEESVNIGLIQTFMDKYRQSLLSPDTPITNTANAVPTTPAPASPPPASTTP